MNSLAQELIGKEWQSWGLNFCPLTPTSAHPSIPCCISQARQMASFCTSSFFFFWQRHSACGIIIIIFLWGGGCVGFLLLPVGFL